ncbi:MAG: Ig-like domain-containing protein, partial [Gemmatimonadota bacterium]|nr:Ig-like domain-containing protein [Gemmatimonadota bacterium]
SAGTLLTGQTFVWSTSNSAIATVEQNGTVTAVAHGTVDVAAAIGAKNNKVTLTITPPPVAASIAVNAGNGQSARVNTPVSQPPSVIVKDAAGDPVAGVTVIFAVTQGGGSVTGATQITNVAGIATVGAWVMGPTAGPQALTATSGTLAGSPVTFTATATALPSNLRQFNVSTTNGCNSIQLRTGEVKAETAHLTIVADLSNPANGFTAADYAAFAATFESLVWPVLTENFGTPTDIDGNGRVVAFFTSAVNALTPAGSTSFVGGFFFARDLLPRIQDGVTTNFDCPGSNVAEMFYVLAPDPTGSLGLAHSTDFVRNLALGVIGHEMQHLINASRRLYISTTATDFETIWMEEGLSHIAEELLFYEASGLRPKSNLGSTDLSGSVAAAAAAHIRSNLSRFSLFLKTPSDESPYANNDRLQTRGATWSLLRYLADRGSASTITGQTCNTTQPLALAVNAFCRIEGGDANQFTIDGSGGSEYAIVAFADGASLQVNGVATNAVALSGPPNPAQLPTRASFTQQAGGRTLDMSFHTRLRQRTQGEITARIPHARARFKQRSRDAARFSISSGASSRMSMSSAFVEPVWGRLVNRGPTGMANLEAEFGAQIRGAFRDWAVANYVDDAVSVSQPNFTHLSWNFRSAMSIPGVSPYAIQTRNLGAIQNHAIVDGGAAYYRLGVAASTTSTVSFTVNAVAPPPNLKLVVVRTK